jgi:hypothetical protein
MPRTSPFNITLTQAVPLRAVIETFRRGCRGWASRGDSGAGLPILCRDRQRPNRHFPLIAHHPIALRGTGVNRPRRV